MERQKMLMPIKDFIHTALVDIARGIHDANEDVSTLGVEFAPRRVAHEKNLVTGKSTETHYSESAVTFDIAVTVAEEQSEGKSGEAKIGVMSAVFGIGVGHKSADENRAMGQNSMVSRIQFTIKASLHHHEPISDKGQR